MTTPDTPTAADAPEAGQASSASTDALLSLESVSKIYGDLHALDNVSLEIRAVSGSPSSAPPAPARRPS